MSLLAASLLAVDLAACQTAEGDRCNPSRSSDECGSGLACIVPPNCVAAVCCPTSATRMNGVCAACPVDAGPADAASDDAGDVGATDATADASPADSAVDSSRGDSSADVTPIDSSADAPTDGARE